jgi:tight adherence protein B
VTVGVAIAGRTRRAKLLDETRAAMVDLCRAMAAELRAGQPLASAFTAAARGAPLSVAEALRPAVAVSRRGDAADLAEVLRAAARAPGCAGLRSIAACWQVATSSGSTLAPAIDRVGDALQDDIDLRRDVTSTLAGPRATAHLLAGLPAVGLLLGTAIGADPVGFLLGSGPGIGCLLAAVALDSAGLAWARRISRRVARFG